MTKTCSICLENVVRTANLDLICNCKYYVHYTCFNKWWKDNGDCIICHEPCFAPNKYKRNRTPVRRIQLLRRRRIRQLPRRIYPPDTRYIHDFIERIPFDNENELKTIFCAFVIAFIIAHLMFRFYSN